MPRQLRVCASATAAISALFRLPRLTTAAVVIAAAATGANAAPVQDDFNDGNDDGWLRYQPIADFGAPGTWTFPNGAYRIQAAVTGGPSTTGPSRAGSMRPDTTSTDFSVSVDLVDWDDSHDQAIGLLARATQYNQGPGALDGYAFTYHTGSDTIWLTVATNEVPTNVLSAPVTLNPANDYRFVFTGQGPQLTGSVYALSNLATPLATVTITDATYTSGELGIVVFDNTGGNSSLGADATWDNFAHPAVIPEPATAAAALLGLAGVCGRIRARRSRSA